MRAWLYRRKVRSSARRLTRAVAEIEAVLRDASLPRSERRRLRRDVIGGRYDALMREMKS